MSKVKRLIAGLLTAAMVLPLMACGGSKSTSGGSSVMDKNHVYSEVVMDFDVDMNNVNTCFLKGDRIYFVSYIYAYGGNGGIMYGDSRDVMEKYSSVETTDVAMNDTATITTTDQPVEPTDMVTDDTIQDDMGVDSDMTTDSDTNVDGGDYFDNSTTYKVTSFLMDGTDKREVELKSSQNENCYYQCFSADTDGNIYYIKNSSTSSEDADGNWNYKEEYFFGKLDISGNNVFEVSLYDCYSSTSEYFYPYNCFVLSTGKCLIMYSEGLLVFSQDGTFEKIISDVAGYDSGYELADGTLLFSKWGDAGQEYYKYDFVTGTMSDAMTVPGNSYNYSIYPGTYYDVYMVNNTGISGYNFGDEEETELLNYVDSDLNTRYVNTIVDINENQFIISYTNYSDYSTAYSLMTKVAPEDVQEKTVLSLACYYLDSDIKTKIVDFNKTNSKYRITVKDYSEFDSYDESTGAYESGTTQFNSDLVAGNVPDIVIINSSLSMTNYQNKGLFTDLYEFIDKDEEMSRDDFMSNILEAYEYNGKLYELVPKFNAITAIAKTSNVGSETGWTLEDLNALIASKPEGTKVFSEVTRNNIISYCMTLGSSQFINWETGECSFDSDAFVSFLTFANTFPEEIDWDSIYSDENYWNNYETQYLNDSVLLSYMYLADFSSYTRNRQVTFGEDVTLIGFPTEDKNGSIIDAYNGFAISSKSKNKDGAWEFVRQFFLEDYQSTISYSWPIRLSAYDALIEKAQERPYYLDENDNKVEYDDTYYMDGVGITLTPCTDEDIDHVMTFLQSLTQVNNYDDDLLTIINEEAAFYFSGQKSAKDVAAVIQSRSNIYVNETR